MTFQLVPILQFQVSENTSTRTSTGLFSQNTSTTRTSFEYEISCVELCQNNLYIGTAQGQLLYYTLSTLPIDDAHSQVEIAASLEIKRSLSLRKAIHGIYAIPTESKLLLLSDSTLGFWDLHLLNPMPPTSIQSLRNVSCICADKLISSPFELSVARKKTVLYLLLDNRLRRENEMTVSEPLISMVRHHSTLCAADTRMYKIIQSDGHEIPLFPYDKRCMDPLMLVINESEFLVVSSSGEGSSTIGIFVTHSGEPIRGSLEWPSPPISIAFTHPHVISLSRNRHLFIHDYKSQKLVQSIAIPKTLNPLFLDTANYGYDVLNNSYKGVIHVILACEEGIYGLSLMDTEYQIQEFLDSRQVESAIMLIEANATTFSHLTTSVYEQSAHICLEETLFDDAFKYFLKAKTDPKIILSMFPEWNSSQGIPEFITNYINQKYPHVDPKETLSFKQGLLIEAKKSIINYLEKCRMDSSLSMEALSFMDSILLKLYIELNVEKLYSFLNQANHCKEQETLELLQENHLYYAKSVYYKSQNKFKNVLEIYIQLCNQELKDTDFPGQHLIYESLSTSQDKELIFEYAPFILEKDVHLGISLFTRLDLFDPESVLDFLETTTQGRDSFQFYLEYIIIQGRVVHSKYYTKLALLYLETIQLFSQDSQEDFLSEYETCKSKLSFEAFLKRQTTPLALAKLNFIRFIRIQIDVDLQLLESRIPNQPEYILERFSILDKQELFKENISLLMSIQDLVGVKEYISKLQGSIRLDCIQVLFQSVLDACRDSDTETLISTLHVLECYTQEVDMIKILTLLPSSTPLLLLKGLLSHFFRSLHHSKLKSQIQSCLTESLFFQTNIKQFDFYSKQSAVYQSKDQDCIICKKSILDPKLFCIFEQEFYHLNCFSLVCSNKE